MAQTAAAAATANSSKPTVLRTISTSQAITRTPPASQASRLGPDGTSRASGQIASAQSRRPAGSSRAAARARRACDITAENLAGARTPITLSR